MKKAIALILSLLMVMSSCMCMASALFEKKEAILRLIVPENWEMDIGDSRTVDCAVKNTSNYVKWSAEPADVAKVDAYGRVTALKEGTAEITAQNADGYTDTVTLKVVKEATKSEVSLAKKDYKGEAVKENEVAATCTADGSYDTVVYCTVCSSESSRATTTVSALGHTEVVDAAKTPTCTRS